ncbi:MAG: TraR/DksA family transcriptional regulator [Alphaproteobacteria bacterium]|nr:TraR/DksA family transcriptional regulator [Alphaproteobacteria bacterium]
MSKKNYKTIQLDPKYKPKVSEEYMGAEQRAYFYKILCEQRDELVSGMNDVMDAINIAQKNKTAGTGDEGDSGNLSTEADMQLKVHARNANLLKKVDRALESLDAGTFGYSLLSGEPIGLKRMMARPLATLTLEEQEEAEKSER